MGTAKCKGGIDILNFKRLLLCIVFISVLLISINVYSLASDILSENEYAVNQESNSVEEQLDLNKANSEDSELSSSLYEQLISNINIYLVFIGIFSAFAIAFGSFIIPNSRIKSLENKLKEYESIIQNQLEASTEEMKDRIELASDSYLKRQKIQTVLLRFDTLVKLGEYHAVISEIDSFIQNNGSSMIDEDYVFLYRRVAECYFWISDYQSVITYLTKAIQLAPNDDNLFSNRSGAYQLLGDIYSAIADIKYALNIDPTVADYYLKLANCYSVEGKHQEALSELTSAINIDDLNPESYLKRGRLKINYLNDSGGLDDIHKAIELAENQLDVEKMKKDFNDSISILSRAYNNMAVYYDSIKDFDKALEFYDKALLHDKSNIFALTSKGASITESENPKEAMQYYYKALDIFPYYNMAYHNIAVNQVRSKQYEEALDSIEKAINFGDRTEQMPYLRAEALFKLGRKDEAMDVINEYIEEHGLKDGFHLRAQIHSDNGNFEDAINDYNEVLDRDIRSYSAYINIASLYYHLERYDDAIKHYNDALLIESKSQYALLGKALSLGLMDLEEEAIAVANKLSMITDSNLVDTFWRWIQKIITTDLKQNALKLTEIVEPKIVSTDVITIEKDDKVYLSFLNFVKDSI